MHFNSCPRCGEQALYMPQTHGGGWTCFRCGLKSDIEGKTNDAISLLIKSLKIQIADLKFKLAVEKLKSK